MNAASAISPATSSSPLELPMSGGITGMDRAARDEQDRVDGEERQRGDAERHRTDDRRRGVAEVVVHARHLRVN